MPRLLGCAFAADLTCLIYEVTNGVCAYFITSCRPAECMRPAACLHSDVSAPVQASPLAFEQRKSLCSAASATGEHWQGNSSYQRRRRSQNQCQQRKWMAALQSADQPGPKRAPGRCGLGSQSGQQQGSCIVTPHHCAPVTGRHSLQHHAPAPPAIGKNAQRMVAGRREAARCITQHSGRSVPRGKAGRCWLREWPGDRSLCASRDVCRTFKL
jgi:hypothetical protein